MLVITLLQGFQGGRQRAKLDAAACASGAGPGRLLPDVGTDPGGVGRKAHAMHSKTTNEPKFD